MVWRRLIGGGCKQLGQEPLLWLPPGIKPCARTRTHTVRIPTLANNMVSAVKQHTHTHNFLLTHFPNNTPSLCSFLHPSIIICYKNFCLVSPDSLLLPLPSPLYPLSPSLQVRAFTFCLWFSHLNMTEQNISAFISFVMRQVQKGFWSSHGGSGWTALRAKGHDSLISANIILKKNIRKCYWVFVVLGC